MNERIRELAFKAANGMLSFDEDGFRLSETEAMRFAELIVQECVKVCADRGTHHDGLYSAWAVDCSKRIEKHFGVE
jgi:hypothetical protein